MNNLLQVLKIDKDTVQNFMQQKNRIDKRLSLADNKKGKSNVTARAMESLAESLGGSEALKNNRPVCHGRYNITDAIQGAVMYDNITQCESLVKTACNFSMSESEKSEVETCNNVMGDFRRDADICKESATNCTCWSELAGRVQSVKECNIGNNMRIS